jgi:hypothetical protein
MIINKGFVVTPTVAVALLVLFIGLGGGYIKYRQDKSVKNNVAIETPLEEVQAVVTSQGIGSSTSLQTDTVGVDTKHQLKKGLKLYTNTKYGYQFEYPDTYTVESGEAAVYLVPPHVTHEAALVFSATNTFSPFEYPSHVDTCLPFKDSVIDGKKASLLACDTGPLDMYMYSLQIKDVASTNWQKGNVISFRLPLKTPGYSDIYSTYISSIASLKFITPTPITSTKTKAGWKTFSQAGVEFQYPAEWATTKFQDTRNSMPGYTSFMGVDMENDQYLAKKEVVHFSVSYDLDVDLQKFLTLMKSYNDEESGNGIFPKTVFTAHSEDAKKMLTSPTKTDCSALFDGICSVEDINGQKWAFSYTGAQEANRHSASFVTFRKGKWLSMNFSELTPDWASTQKEYFDKVEYVMNSVNFID